MMLRKLMPALTAGALVLAGLSFSTVPAVAAPVAAEATPAPGATIDRTNKQQILDVFKWINQYRASLGVPPVTFNATISEVAEDWSDTMAVDGFRHNPGYWTDSRVTNRWTHAAEIIAANGDEEGEALVVQWINSPPHEAILRDPAFKVIGVGITRSFTGPYSTYGTVNFFTYPEGLEPPGAYTTAQDFFDGQPTNDPTAVTPAAPTFNSATGEYVIPAKQPGVEYYVRDVLQTPGTHSSGWQPVSISARASSGYVLRGTTTWTFAFQPKRITASAPTFNDAAATYTIPAQDGVRYVVGNGSYGSDRVIPAGTYPGAGLVTVSVQAAEGFVLDNEWAGWTHNFPVPTPPVTEPPVITPPGPSPSFSDISTSGFQEAIGWMKARGISTGYTDGTYRPAESVSREAMAAFVYRLAGKPAFTAPAKSPFTDVPTNHQFYKEISWMKASGLSTGWADGTYRPYDTVSREAMAAFMKRFAGSFCSRFGALHFGAPSVPTFGDSRSSIFYTDIEWMRVAGVSTGWPDRTYRPFENVTREAMAAFMQRLDAYITANGGCPA